MREIYISDLDDTLLDPKANLPEYSKVLLNTLMEQGLCFTVASARSPFSALPILDGLVLRYPLVLLNGSLLYYPEKEKIVHSTVLPKDSVARIIEAVNNYCPHFLIVGKEGNNIEMQYFQEDKEYWNSLVDYSYFQQKNNFSLEILSSKEEINRRTALYALLSFDEPLKFDECRSFLQEDKKLFIDAYKDRYLENRWYIEIFSNEVSKQYGIQRLQKLYSFEKWIAFGNGENDISMFRQCDEGIAVANSCSALKAVASEIIGSNVENAVAKYLQKRFQRE